MMKMKLLLVLLAVVGLMAGAAQANMLLNPSFEEGTFTGSDPTPDYWEHWYTTYNPVHSWVDDSDEAHSGEKYMKMYNWFVNDTDSSSSGWLGQDVPDVKVGKDYSFSVWAKNDAEGQTNEVAIEVEWLDSLDDLIGINNVVGRDFVTVLVTDSDWIEIDFGAFTVPEGAIAGTIWLAAPVGNGLNAICYDDVSMLGPDPNINAGPDMVSWDGQTVSLTGSESLPSGYSTITWSAEPNYCAEITDGDTLTPTVQVNPVIEIGPATIANHSFENGLDNWDIISGDGHGTWNGYAYDADTGESTVYITPTDGRMCAYLDGDPNAGTLSQVLANTLAADTTYMLTVDVVNDGHYEENVGYGVQLLAGETVIAEDANSHPLDTYGVWETSTVTFATGATHEWLGERLEIRLIAQTGTNKMNFDNVHLTADPPFPAYVPDILPLTLTLDIDGNKYNTMKIDVYPDACAAKLGAGLREATDLVGDNCITSLVDLAETAKTWAVDNALTEPKAEEEQQVQGIAKSIYIANHGFEVPIHTEGDYTDGAFDGQDPSVDWSHVTGAWSGVWNPDADGVDGWYGYEGIAPEGENIGYVTSNSGGEITTIKQTLTETLAVFTNYTLSLQVGNNSYYEGGIYTIELLAGGTPLASLSESTDNIEYDKFETRTIKYECHPDHRALIGQPLEIQMSIVGAGDEFDFDDVTLYYESGMIPSPADGAYVVPTSELKLGWTNMDPNYPNEHVYIDVWFGMDPNDYKDFNKIVDAVEDAYSVTVDVSTLGTYYWQINSYIYGDPATVDYSTGGPNDPNIIKGPMWEFYVVTDPPVSVKAGDDWVTWSGQAVALDATVVDEGVPALTWSADPNDGVVFDPNEFVEDPTVTITKVTNNPSTVTLTLLAEDAASSDEDTMTIEVYDNPCLAAIGEGIAEYDPGDFDADCDTDLADLAAIAEEWLVYSELTGSIIKP